MKTNGVLQQSGVIEISGKKGQKNAILLCPFLNASPSFRPLLFSYIPGAKFSPPVTFLVQLCPETLGTQVMSETRLDQKEMCGVFVRVCVCTDMLDKSPLDGLSSTMSSSNLPV